MHCYVPNTAKRIGNILQQNLQGITYLPRTPAVHLRPTGEWTWRWKPSATDASTSKLS